MLWKTDVRRRFEPLQEIALPIRECLGGPLLFHCCLQCLVRQSRFRVSLTCGQLGRNVLTPFGQKFVQLFDSFRVLVGQVRLFADIIGEIIELQGLIVEALDQFPISATYGSGGLSSEKVWSIQRVMPVEGTIIELLAFEKRNNGQPIDVV